MRITENQKRQAVGNVTYDVTAVSHDGQHVPLTARTSYSMAHEIARPRSMDEHWREVQIRLSGTGEIIAAYELGSDADSAPR